MPESAPPPEPTVVRLPLLRTETDGARVLLKVVGSTLAPVGSVDGMFLSPSGYTADKPTAQDFRGPGGGSQIVVQEGPPGKSAYQLWLERGNTGTVEQYLASLIGKDGDAVELRADSGFIQWRRTGGTWMNLIAVADLKGADGKSVELQKTATAIQWRQTGGTWADLVLLSAITGPAGPSGATLVGTVTLAETALLTLALGVRRVTTALSGAVTTGSYVAIPVSAPPAGYSIQDAYCSTANQITVGLIVPALGVATSYSIQVRIYRLG